MSSNSNASIVPEPKKQVILGTFTNSLGEVFTIRGLSPLEPQQITGAIQARWQADGRAALLETMTYTVTNVAGIDQVFEHDAETIKQADAETQAKYAAHLKAVAEFNNSVNQKTMRACFLCVQDDPQADKQWKERMEFLEIPLPENSAALKNLYVETRVLSGASDVAALMSAVMQLSGIIDEATASAAQDTFQRAMEGARAPIAAT